MKLFPMVRLSGWDDGQFHWFVDLENVWLGLNLTVKKTKTKSRSTKRILAPSV